MKLRSIAVAGAMAMTGAAAGAAAPATAAQAAPSNCVKVIESFDFALRYCYHLEGPCLVSETRTTKLGTETRCLVPRPV
jgi:hypothetical protein